MFDIFKYLQLFAEGEGSGGSSDGEQAAETGVQVPDAGEQKRQNKRNHARLDVEFGKAPDADANAEQSPETAEVTANNRKTYEEIKKEYEKEIGEDIKNAIKGRFKTVKNTETELKRTRALLSRFAERDYQITAGEDGALDLDELEKAVHADDSFYEDMAAAMGTSTEFARQFDDQKRELDKRRAEDYHREELAKFEQIVNQAQKAREIFPDLDLDVEMSNPDFARLVASNVPVETAYRVIHDAEITMGAMQYAARQAKIAMSESIQAGQNRPSENGLGRGAAANVQRITDPRLLSKEQRRELRSRVARGEKIVW